MFGTVSIPAILAAAPGMAGSTIGFAGMRVDTMTLLCLLLFIGAMGKSAQIGLHTWLPDAMEGPTPVSALIHAATMVTAGVFMVCRLSPMFETSPTAMHVVTYVGAATCIFAATVGCAQNDIKRVIAYSTCSQLGYMFFAAGVGAYGAAMFHLFTHAFFKALLFLGAGSVIHAMHHEQDMRYYGALRKRDPDHLLGDGHRHAGDHRRRPRAGRLRRLSGRRTRSSRAPGRAASVPGTIAFWLGALAALLTSFYSLAADLPDLLRRAALGGVASISSTRSTASTNRRTRSMATARTMPRMPPARHRRLSPARKPADDAGPDRAARARRGARRAGLSTAFSSTPSARPNSGAAASRSASISPMPRTKSPPWVKLTPTVVMLIGLWIAWHNYIRAPGRAGAFRRAVPGGLPVRRPTNGISTSSTTVLFVRPALWLGRLFWKGGDEGTIDRFGPHGAAYAVGIGNRITARLQSGYLYSYALVMLLGLIGAASWAIWWAR